MKYWVISALEYYPQHAARDNVVFTIHWRRMASDDLGHEVRIDGSQEVTLDAKEPFTAYQDLTPSQVERWLEDAMGPETLAALDAELDRQIANLINPPIVVAAPPWAVLE